MNLKPFELKTDAYLSTTVMQAGFSILEVGTIRAKNAKNIMIKVSTCILHRDAIEFNALHFITMSIALPNADTPIPCRIFWMLALEHSCGGDLDILSHTVRAPNRFYKEGGLN